MMLFGGRVSIIAGRRPAIQSSRSACLNGYFTLLLARFCAFRDMHYQQTILGIGADFVMINAAGQFDRALEASIMPLGKHEAFAFFLVAFGFLSGQAQHSV